MDFKAYHPAIHFIYFTAVIVVVLVFAHPAFLVCSYLCAFLCSSFMTGKKGLQYNLFILPLPFIFSLIYSAYNHFGITILYVNFIGNNITLEALIKGLVAGVKVAAVLMWLNAMYSVMTRDEIIYLFGRICPKLSLYIAIFLRLVPCCREMRHDILFTRKCAGIKRSTIGNFFTCEGILITWLAERCSYSADSMRSRGYTLSGRTAFSLYRFGNSDRICLITLSMLLSLLASAYILGDTKALYSSIVVVDAMSVRKFFFCTIYMVFCMIPIETSSNVSCI